MKRILILLLSVWPVLAFADTPQTELSEKYLKYIEQADSAIKESNWAQAEALYLQATRLEPANPANIMLLSNVGMMRHYSGRDSLALDILDTAIRMAPSAVVLRLNRASILTSIGQFDNALKEYYKVSSLDSTIAEPHFMRAIIHLQRGKLNECTLEVDTLQQRFPSDRMTWTASSYLYITQKKYLEAIPMLNKLIDNNPDATDYGERGYCHLMCDNLNEASTDIAEAIRLDPLNGDFYLYRALLNKRRYRPNEAADDVKQAHKLGVSAQKVSLLGL